MNADEDHFHRQGAKSAKEDAKGIHWKPLKKAN
jgi:hypothetical protein